MNPPNPPKLYLHAWRPHTPAPAYARARIRPPARAGAIVQNFAGLGGFKGNLQGSMWLNRRIEST